MTTSPSRNFKIFLNIVLVCIHRYHFNKFGLLTSEKYVVTTVRSANFLPARARRAFPADSGVSNLTKIFPTPLDCLLPPVGLGTFISKTFPNFSHSSFTSSQISANLVSK
jgi:hypothetical protein